MTLAKVANRTAKKDPASRGMRIVESESEIERALARMELTDLWGVARRTAGRLEAIEIKTRLELRQADAGFVRQHCSVVMERIVLELQFTTCHSFETVVADRKSIMASR